MQTLLWAECQKLRRSKIIWIAIFATVMIAAIIFASGQELYNEPDVHYGLKTVYKGTRYIDNAGWYMDEIQPWATFFVLPGVISLVGCYLICREEDEDTIKSLRIIPVNETKLIAAKMLITLAFSISLYMMLFAITSLTEIVLHACELSTELVLRALKEYFLDGAGVFLAISPMIALVSRMRRGHWIALVFTEIYCIAGMFASMSNVLRTFYPVTAVFNVSGYLITTVDEVIKSMISLLFCGCLSAFILKGMKTNKKI